jgi:RNA polymerase sigma factor (sigma-70 family)
LLIPKLFAVILKDNSTKGYAVRLQLNDREAFNTLYEKYHAAIYCNALKITHNTAAAEDIVQEVFIALWEKRHQLDPEQDITGWLFVVSYNKSITYLKRELKGEQVKIAVQAAAADEGTDETEELNGTQINMLEDAIQKLPPQKRKVFELCIWPVPCFH